jgi:hypothetical protein
MYMCVNANTYIYIYIYIPTYCHALMYALGLYPSSKAFSSDMISTADAPSVRYDELAAVCVPCGLIKAGPSLAHFSIVLSPGCVYQVFELIQL